MKSRSLKIVDKHLPAPLVCASTLKHACEHSLYSLNSEIAYKRICTPCADMDEHAQTCLFVCLCTAAGFPLLQSYILLHILISLYVSNVWSILNIVLCNFCLNSGSLPRRRGCKLAMSRNPSSSLYIFFYGQCFIYFSPVKGGKGQRGNSVTNGGVH